MLHHERAILTQHGRSDLARRVRWSSKEDGDGLGYDIASFSPDGQDRLIEVKTTTGWERTPFHISRNELEVAEERRDHWHLLRLYEFAREPKAFELRPPTRHACLADRDELSGKFRMTDRSRRFRRTIGIAYSGAQTAESSLQGLRVFEPMDDGPAVEVPPPPSPETITISLSTC